MNPISPTGGVFHYKGLTPDQDAAVANTLSSIQEDGDDAIQAQKDANAEYNQQNETTGF